MTLKQLRTLLVENKLPEPKKGYNYAMFVLYLPAKHVKETVGSLRRRRHHFEQKYRKTTGEKLGLLPYVCIPRKRSILVPVPYGARVNVLSDIIGRLGDLRWDVKVPQWS